MVVRPSPCAPYTFVSFGRSRLTFSLSLLVLQRYSMPSAAWEATRSLSRRPASEVRPLLCAILDLVLGSSLTPHTNLLSVPVIALDINPTRLALARHNAFQYGVADRIEFILCDFVSFARQLAAQQAKTASSGSSTKDARPLGGIDVVFLSPPWGGISYLSMTEPTQPSTLQIEPSPSSMTPSDPTLYPLSALAPLHGKELFELARGITQDVAYYLPRNSDLEECAALADEGEQVEVEEEWMGSKLKAITVLYGGLPKKVKEARGTEVES